MSDGAQVKWDYRALPDPEHPHGVQQLSEERRPLVTDAGYFPTREMAEAWAKSRGWKVYEFKHAVGV